MFCFLSCIKIVVYSGTMRCCAFCINYLQYVNMYANAYLYTEKSITLFTEHLDLDILIKYYLSKSTVSKELFLNLLTISFVIMLFSVSKCSLILTSDEFAFFAITEVCTIGTSAV